jgi:hypothetical protein
LQIRSQNRSGRDNSLQHHIIDLQKASQSGAVSRKRRFASRAKLDVHSLLRLLQKLNLLNNILN